MIVVLCCQEEVRPPVAITMAEAAPNGNGCTRNVPISEPYMWYLKSMLATISPAGHAEPSFDSV